MARPAPVRSIHAIVRESVAGTKPGQVTVELLRARASSADL
ncbi:hypothetical protein ACQP2E_21295 [Actinoplanes sp. CA-015351]